MVKMLFCVIFLEIQLGSRRRLSAEHVWSRCFGSEWLLEKWQKIVDRPGRRRAEEIAGVCQHGVSTIVIRRGSPECRTARRQRKFSATVRLNRRDV